MNKVLVILIVALMGIALIGCGGGDSNNKPPVDPLVQGLQAYYPFDGNANDVINHNDGTVNGAILVNDRKGNAEKAYHFDGSNDLITFANHDAHSGNDQNKISVSVWVKPETAGSGQTVIDASGFSLYYVTYGVAFTIWRGINSGMSVEYSDSTSETNPFIDIWTHLVGTFDGTKIRLYINGVSTGDGVDLTDPIFDRNESMVLGEESNIYWQGSIDDLRIYDRVLSQTEILSLYNR